MRHGVRYRARRTYVVVGGDVNDQTFRDSRSVLSSIELRRLQKLAFGSEQQSATSSNENKVVDACHPPEGV